MNKAMVIGKLGADPKITTDRNGGKIASFSVATNESYRDRSGKQHKTTDWHDIVIFGGYAEVAEKYLKKGAQVYVEGKMHKSRWEDKNGVVRYNFNINAQSFDMLSSASNNTTTNPQSAYQDKPQQARPQAKPQAAQQAASTADDDIPF